MLTAMVLAMIAGMIHDSLMRGPLGAPGLGGKLILFLPAIIVGVAGFVRFLYAWLLETEVPNAPELPRRAALKSALTADDHLALPPSHSIPAAGFGVKRGETAEMVPVPSVTENTTKLLDQ
jgi:hypothetical protein